jgi:hypothetical protein
LKRGASAGFVIIGSILLIVLLLSGCSDNAITGKTIVAPERVVFSTEKEGCNYKLLDNSVTLENVTLAKALGSSMRPSIETGDTMLIKPYTKDTPLREGMIVSYTKDGKELVHRIDALYIDYFTAKGDNADVAEDVPYSAINGIVVGVLFNK